MAVICSFLQKRKIVIRKRTAFTVPIHDKGGDAHVLRLLDLVVQHGGIVTGIADVDVNVIAEPRHVDREEFWPGIRCLGILPEGVLYSGRGTSGTHHETHERNT